MARRVRRYTCHQYAMMLQLLEVIDHKTENQAIGSTEAETLFISRLVILGMERVEYNMFEQEISDEQQARSG